VRADARSPYAPRWAVNGSLARGLGYAGTMSKPRHSTVEFPQIRRPRRPRALFWLGSKKTAFL